MTNLTEYEKGCSPCALQRKYSLTYVQGYELAERLKKTQELEKENAKLKKQLAIAVDFIEFITRYNCKVITPKDFNKYEAVWFLIRSEAVEKLKQIKELDK